jgi:uncharacterized membrane protein YqaE (UPF0057 family)
MKYIKYFLTFMLPWVAMLIIEENTAALICFILQLTIIGAIPAGIYACYKFKKHMQQQKVPSPKEQTASTSNEK